MAEAYANNVAATVQAGITSAATSVTVDAAVSGASAADTFRLVNARTGEILQLAAGANTTTWTIVRAAEDSTRFPAAAMLFGDLLHVIVTRAVFAALAPLLAPVTITTTTTLTDAHKNRTLLVDATAGAVTLTPPTAVGLIAAYTVKKMDVGLNAVIFDPNGSELVDGATTFSFSQQYEAHVFESTGSAWVVR